MEDKTLCPKCNANEASEEYHTCPYKEEIGDDYDTECNCCDKCMFECLYSI